jgi:hypothetical protein
MIKLRFFIDWTFDNHSQTFFLFKFYSIGVGG